MAIAAVIGVVLLVSSPRKIALGDDSYGNSEFISISGEDYEAKIKNGDTFLLFVDAAGCITADHVRSFVTEISEAKNLHFYHIMWPEARNTSLHDSVKYYPSVVIVDGGKILDFLKADSDDYAEYYQNVGALRGWLDKYIEWK